MSAAITTFATLDALAIDLRQKLENKKYLLLFAYNGTGKTRLSMAFKEAGKKHISSPLEAESGDTLTTESGDVIIAQEAIRDTLYFNAFTEDLFVWDNDLENDSQRVLRLNKASSFFAGLEELEMDNRIRPFLQPLADFDFRIDTDNWTISFFRSNGADDHIKISRGEERIFVWCFFLAVAQLAMDAQEGEAYDWVKFVYIDDPISSLDDNNAIAVASRLAQMLKKQNRVKAVISSHHTLFFNVLCNELSKALKFFLNKTVQSEQYHLRIMKGDTARFYHVAMLKEIKQAADSGALFTYHFGILRNLLEKTAYFHGFTNFGNCITHDEDDEEGVIRKRIISLLNHGNYSLFEPVEMLPENKDHFRNILNDFLSAYRFNPDIFSQQITQESET